MIGTTNTEKQTNSPIKSILTLDNMHDFTCSDFTICQVVNKLSAKQCKVQEKTNMKSYKQKC